jgi:tetratricopeptide (TPR) repeat protein
MDMRQFWLLIGCQFLIVWGMIAAADGTLDGTLDDTFHRANALYESGDFDGAWAMYESILETHRHFASEFNAGNCAFKLGNMGPARLHYERAKLLEPHNDQLQANLALVESNIVDRIEAVPSLGLTTWLSTWVGPSQLTTWGVWASIWWTLGWGLLIWRMRKTEQDSRSTLAFLAMGCLAFGAMGMLGVQKSLNVTQQPSQVVVMTDRQDVLSTPSSAGTVLFQLHEGVRACILERTEGWTEIELDNGNVGWIANDAIVEV